MKTDQKQSTHLPVFVMICIGFNCIMLVFPLLLHDLDKMLGDYYLLLYVWIFLIYVVLVGFIVASVFYFFARYKSNYWKALIPFLLNGITLLVLLFTPYIETCWDLRAKIDLQANMPYYAQVITQVNIGSLQSDDKNGHIRLSSEREDFILVDKSKETTSVFFNYGTSITYSGFIYRSNDTPPPIDLMNSYWIHCKHYEMYWYYCSSLD